MDESLEYTGQSVVVDDLELVAERRSFVKCLLTRGKYPGRLEFLSRLGKLELIHLRAT